MQQRCHGNSEIDLQLDLKLKVLPMGMKSQYGMLRGHVLQNTGRQKKSAMFDGLLIQPPDFSTQKAKGLKSAIQFKCMEFLCEVSFPTKCSLTGSKL